MNRARTSSYIKLKNSITQEIINHFQKQDHHEVQHGKTFLKHVLIWRNKEIENLLVFEATSETVMFGCCKLETDEACRWYWGMVEMFWLSNPWKCSNRILPWMNLEKTELCNGCTVEIQGLQQLQNDDGWWSKPKPARALEVLWRKVQQCTKWENERNGNSVLELWLLFFSRVVFRENMRYICGD